MVYTAPTEVAFRSKSGSLSKKLCTELALIQAEVLTAEISDVGTTSATFTVDSDSTAGKIAVTVVGGGTNNTLTITNQVLGGNVTITLPNATGTLATLAGVEALTGKSLNMNAAALLTGTGTPVLKFGDIDTAVSYLLTATFVPVQVKVSAGAAVTGTLGAGYFSTLTGAALAAGGQLATLIVRATVSHNLLDAYGLQTHMTIGDDMATTNSNAHLTPFSSKLVLTGGKTASRGWANAGLFIVDGAGAVTQMCYGVSIVAEVGAAAVQALLHLYSDETINAAIAFTESTHFTHLFDFAAADQGFITADAGVTAANRTHKLKVDIGGVAGYINLYAA